MSQQQVKPTPPAPSPAQGPAVRSGLDAYYKDWEKRAAAAYASSSSRDWSGVDFSKLTSKDLSVEFGPVFTEEQFKERMAQKKNEKKFSHGR